jgi:hypothetical protein
MNQSNLQDVQTRKIKNVVTFFVKNLYKVIKANNTTFFTILRSLLQPDQQPSPYWTSSRTVPNTWSSQRLIRLIHSILSIHLSAVDQLIIITLEDSITNKFFHGGKWRACALG